MDSGNPKLRTGRLRVRHLTLVQRLAELGSMRKAAESLNVTQPAASAMLKEVESQLGITLFARSRTGVATTEGANALLRRIRIVLNEIDALAEDLRHPPGHRPVVRLGTVPHAHLGVLQGLAAYCARVGRFRLRLQEGPSPVLLEMLLAGELDALVGRLPAASGSSTFPAEVRHRKLYEEPMSIACGVNHPLAIARSVTPEDLAACSWVLPSQESLSRRALEDAFLLCGRAAPAPLIEVSSYVYGLAMVARSSLLTIAPRTAVRAQEALEMVRTLKTTLQLQPTSIYWMRRRSSDGDAALDDLERWLLGKSRETGAALRK